MVICRSGGSMCSAQISATTSRIIWRGTGLMAGSPGGIGNPALVTIPTPSPAENMMPEPGSNGTTWAITVAPWVQSGSSPASLTIPANAPESLSDSKQSGKWGVSPLGRDMLTGSGNSPVTSAVSAALVAAVAHAPVVQPRRSSPFRPVFSLAFHNWLIGRHYGGGKALVLSPSLAHILVMQLNVSNMPEFHSGWVWLVGSGTG